MTKRNASLSGNGREGVLQLVAEAAEYGLVRANDATGRPRYEVTCAECGRTGGMFHASVQSAKQVVAHLRKQGWLLNVKQTPVCSTLCARKAKDAKRRKAEVEALEAWPRVTTSTSLPAPTSLAKPPTTPPEKLWGPPTPKPPPTPTLDTRDHRARFVLAWSRALADKVENGSMHLDAAYWQAKQERNKVEAPMTKQPVKIQPPVVATPAIGPNPKIARRVNRLLDDHFDEEKRLYREGWSDDRVAKEADAAIDFVINTRRVAYAELAEDPEATQLRATIKAVEDKMYEEVNTIFTAIDELKARFERHVAGGFRKAQK